MIENAILPIYFDYSSTSPVDPRVLEKIIPYFYYKFGNYSSRNHFFGWQIEYVVENSRKIISEFFNCEFREIIFTSGATESNNIAIKGVSLFYKNKGINILALKIDHKSILFCLYYLIDLGYNIIFLNFKKNGLIDLNSLLLHNKDVILLTIMLINNEIGTFQNIKFLSKFCKNYKIIFHVDAVQAIGKIDINLNDLKIDIMTISCHKVYGPKGIGALYIRRKSNIYIKPLFHGGGHEKGLRSGTLNTPQIIGLSELFLILKMEMWFNNLRIKNYKNIILLELLKIDSIYINGDIKYRVPYNLNISFNYLEGESLILSLKNFALSTGSACASKNLEPSYVLNFLNKSYNILHSSLRFTFGRFNILNDFYYLINLLNFSVNNLRKFSPLI